MNDHRAEILKHQIYSKMENYEMSSNILAGLIVEKRDSTTNVFEDICSNFFNALSLFIWTSAENRKQITLSNKIQSAISISVEFCSKNEDKINLREVYLNLCILLAVDMNLNCGIFTHDQFVEYSKDFYRQFQRLLKKDHEEAMDTEELKNELGEKEKDLLISKVLGVIFEKKNNKIKVLTEDIEKLERDYQKLGTNDLFLKTSVLSYLLFMKMNMGESSNFSEISKEIEIILLNLKKSTLGKKLKALVEKSLLFNKTITLLLRGKYHDVKDYDFSTNPWENLAIKSY